MVFPKKWVLAIVTVLFAAGLIYIIAHPRNRPVRLPDGSTLRLAGVTIGTNAFVDGTFGERILGKMIPARGLKFPGFNLARPRVLNALPLGETNTLTAWFVLQAKNTATARLIANSRRVAARIFAANNNGRALENGPGIVFRFSTNEALFAVPLTAFPRDGEEFYLRFFQRPVGGWELSEVAEFPISNPFPSSQAQWVEQPLPATVNFADLTVSLEKVQVREDYLLATQTARDARLEFHMNSPWREDKGRMFWQLVDCLLWDEEGNFHGTFSNTEWSNDAAALSLPFALEPDRVWKVQVKLVRFEQRISSFLTTSLPGSRPLTWLRDAPPFGNFASPLFPIYPGEELLEFPILPGQRLTRTNQAGVIVSCQFDGKKLDFEYPSSEGKHLFMLVRAATDANGNPLLLQRNGLSSSPLRPQLSCETWLVMKSVAGLNVQVTFPKTVTAEFFVKPTKQR